ncbi:protein kinase c zeta type isoform x1 [Limosa lapponica baueri]|uniref:Protein kinase c zeta type isoform x1 n=1 Tax=Limosa lapponica baueri TaxID=1758121 RepID=A0A2I0TK28_LIMLA|nr:protein kinase c zeta type isoform x1 [Limosa lapponica baueri]
MRPAAARDILITNLDASMSYDELCDEVHEMCNLQQEQPITLKWIDDEGFIMKGVWRNEPQNIKITFTVLFPIPHSK